MCAELVATRMVGTIFFPAARVLVGDGVVSEKTSEYVPLLPSLVDSDATDESYLSMTSVSFGGRLRHAKKHS